MENIGYKYYDGHYTHTVLVTVEKVKTYQGHDIYKDKDGWYYVQDNYGEWQYFALLREAQLFIRMIY